MNKQYYFAYGSNMLTRRLVARVGDVDVIGIAKLPDYQLRFNKSGADGSGKCNIMAQQGSDVWGVLFALTDEQKLILDVFEGVGHGYNAVNMAVEHPNHVLQPFIYEVFVYEALDKATSDTAKPYQWYKDFVCFGAKEHNLPIAYQQMLDAVEAIEDKDLARQQENVRVLVG